MNTFHHHIPFIQLVDLVEGRVPPDHRNELERHISACVQCSNEATQLKRLIELMRTDVSENAPSSVIAGAVNLFQSRDIRMSTSTDLRHRILAELRFDSQGLAPSFGVRSGDSGPRQLLFAAVGFDTDVRIYEIDLRIEPAGHDWIVSGQLLGAPAVGRPAELQGATRRELTTFNEQNEFILPPVQSGQYTLVLHLTNVDLEVGDLTLGA